MKVSVLRFCSSRLRATARARGVADSRLEVVDTSRGRHVVGVVAFVGEVGVVGKSRSAGCGRGEGSKAGELWSLIKAASGGEQCSPGENSGSRH
jgi:hypothetical protein